MNYYNKNYYRGNRADSVAYYKRYLLQKAMSVYKWKIPENWDLNYFLYELYINGHICVTDWGRYGIICQGGTLGKRNIYYNPAEYIITNPELPQQSKTVRLGVDGDIIALSPDYCGIMDIVDEFAEMMANTTAAINSNIYNSRLSYVFYAENRQQADSYKKLYDEISTGTPAVFIDKKLGTVTLDGSIKENYTPFNAELVKNYLGSTLLDDLRKIEHLFCQRVGIPNTNTEKKERMNIDETNKTDVESMANATLWLEWIRQGISNVLTLYPSLSLSCNLRYTPQEEGGESDEGGTGNFNI